jgi:hypothetical protein
MGHKITPAVMSKLNVPPNSEIPAGFKPSVFSKENIFAPMNSATMALVRNNIPKTKNK